MKCCEASILKILLASSLFLAFPVLAQTTPTANEKSVGTACANASFSADFDSVVQFNSTNGTSGTMQKAPLFVGSVTAPPYASTSCGSDKTGMLQSTGTNLVFCNGTAWVNISDGGVPGSFDGQCGTDHEQTLSSRPTNLCSVGIASTAVGSGPWTWTCQGMGSGATVNCTAYATLINGGCGSSNGLCQTYSPLSVYASNPTAVCSSGTPVENTPPGVYTGWSWACMGAGGGANAGCSTNANGACGYANGVPQIAAPTQSNGCVAGTFYGLNTTTNSYSWTCKTGCSSGGSDASCSAPRVASGECNSALTSLGASATTSNSSSLLQTASLYSGYTFCSGGTLVGTSTTFLSPSTGTSGGPFTWSCAGSGGGLTANCSANYLPACNATSTVGTKCRDGSVYAGVSTDGSVAMYAYPCDYGQTWDGSACTGTRSTIKWQTAEGTTTGATSLVTGYANTNTVAAYGSSAPAAYYCKNTLAGGSALGHSDWYLPAYNELHVMWAGRSSIGNFVPDASDPYYWSSSEYSSVSASLERFYYGTKTDGLSKIATYYARCVRKGN